MAQFLLCTIDTYVEEDYPSPQGALGSRCAHRGKDAESGRQKVANGTPPKPLDTFKTAKSLVDQHLKIARDIKTKATNLGRSIAASGVGQQAKAYLESVAQRAKVWGELSEQTVAIVRPLMDKTGAIGFSNFKGKTFEEFCNFLVAQLRLDDNHSFRSPYADLLKNPKYKPLLEFLYQQSNKDYPLNAPAHFIEILLREFTAELINIDADSFVNAHIGDLLGRGILRGIISNDGYSRDTKIDLLEAMRRVGKERLGQAHELDKNLSWFNINRNVSDKELRAASKAALKLLGDIEAVDNRYNQAKTEYAIKSKEKATHPDAVSQLQKRLADVVVMVSDERLWGAVKIGDAKVKDSVRSYVLDEAKRLFAEGNSVRTEEGLEKFNDDVRTFLTGSLLIKIDPELYQSYQEHSEMDAVGRAATPVMIGLDKALDQGLVTLLGDTGGSFKKAVTDLDNYSGMVAYAKEMGETILIVGSPAIQNKEATAAVANLVNALTETRMKLWFGYKQHSALSRGMSQAARAIAKGNIAEIKAANAQLNAITSQLIAAKAEQEINKALDLLRDGLEEDGVIYKGFSAAEMDGIEGSIQLVQTMATIAAIAAITKGVGGAVAGGAEGAEAIVAADTVAAVTQAGRAMQFAQQAAIRSGKALVLGAEMTIANNAVELASGQAGATFDLESWTKDAFATGLSMMLTGLLPVGPGTSQSILKNMWARYTVGGTKAALRFVADTGIETIEEAMDQMTRAVLDGKTDSLTLAQLKELAVVCATGGFAKAGEVAEAIKGDVKAPTTTVHIPNSSVVRNYSGAPFVNSVVRKAAESLLVYLVRSDEGKKVRSEHWWVQSALRLLGVDEKVVAETMVTSLSFYPKISRQAEAMGIRNPAEAFNLYMRGELSVEPSTDELREVVAAMRKTYAQAIYRELINNPEMPTIYPVITREYADTHAQHIETLVQEFRAKHGRDPRIVEINAGDGSYAQALNRRLAKNGIHISAYDIDPGPGRGRVKQGDGAKIAATGDIIISRYPPTAAPYITEVARYVASHPDTVLIFTGSPREDYGASNPFWKVVEGAEGLAGEAPATLQQADKTSLMAGTYDDDVEPNPESTIVFRSKIQPRTEALATEQSTPPNLPPPQAAPLSPRELSKALHPLYEQMAEYDGALAAKRNGISLSPEQQQLLADPTIQALSAQRLALLKQHNQQLRVLHPDRAPLPMSPETAKLYSDLAPSTSQLPIDALPTAVVKELRGAMEFSGRTGHEDGVMAAYVNGRHNTDRVFTSNDEGKVDHSDVKKTQDAILTDLITDVRSGDIPLDATIRLYSFHTHPYDEVIGADSQTALSTSLTHVDGHPFTHFSPEDLGSMDMQFHRTVHNLRRAGFTGLIEVLGGPIPSHGVKVHPDISPQMANTPYVAVIRFRSDAVSDHHAEAKDLTPSQQSRAIAEGMAAHKDAAEKVRGPTSPEAIAMKKTNGKTFLTIEEFQNLIDEQRFSHKKRGTYYSPEGALYLYAKKNFIVGSLAEAQEKVALLNELTQKGILFPGTLWAIAQKPSGNFQIFGITRKLQPSHKVMGSFDKPINEWKNRIDASKYPGILNFTEADFSNNWGWSEETGHYYPIDIEVINFFVSEAAWRVEIEHEQSKRTDDGVPTL